MKTNIGMRDFGKIIKVKEARIKVKLLGPISWTFKREVKESIHGPVMEFDHGTFAFRIFIPKKPQFFRTMV